MTQTREQLLAERDAIDAQIKALDADPLLIEAREIVASKADEIINKSRPYYWSSRCREGCHDHTLHVRIALAALRRGMELQRQEGKATDALRECVQMSLDNEAALSRAPMGEAEIEALARECCAKEYEDKGLEEAARNYRTGEYKAASDVELRIAIAAIRATLSRVPVAAWPGDVAEKVAEAAARFCAELQEDADGVPKPELETLHEALNAWEGLGPRIGPFDDTTPQTSALADLEELERDPHATDRQRRTAARALVAFSGLIATPSVQPARGLGRVRPVWMGDRCTTETICAAYGRCMPIIGQDCRAKGGAA